MKTEIYKLIDPETFEIKYIGKTTQPLITRLKHHLNKAKQKPNTSKKIIKSEIITIDKITYCLFLEQIEHLELTQFPNLIEYHDIINSNILNICINNLFYIVIRVDETCNGTFQSISIILDRENIYKDKIESNLTKIINIILESF